MRRAAPLDVAILAVSYVGISVPEFVTGLVLILALAGPGLPLFPTGGYAEPAAGLGPWLRHLALPAATLTLVLLAHVVRQTRSGVADVLRAPYIRTARLKGAGEGRVIVRHALRNGLLPTITVLALDLGYLMGGIVIVEEVFAYPGMGRLIIYAIQNRDVPLLQVSILIVASVYAVANFGADLVYAWLNPRIRYDDRPGVTLRARVVLGRRRSSAYAAYAMFGRPSAFGRLLPASYRGSRLDPGRCSPGLVSFQRGWV